MPFTIRRRRGAHLGTGVLLVATLLSACGGSKDVAVTGPTVPMSLAPTTTTTTVVSYDVPAVIDHAYVQKVVTAHDKALGDAIRLLVRDQALSFEFLKYLVGLYTEDEFTFQENVWVQSISAGRLAEAPAIPGDPVTSVQKVIESSASCIIARTERDHSANYNGVPVESPTDDYIVLVLKQPDRDPLAINPTPWVMSFDGSKNDNSVPRNSCDD